MAEWTTENNGRYAVHRGGSLGDSGRSGVTYMNGYYKTDDDLKVTFQYGFRVVLYLQP